MTPWHQGWRCLSPHNLILVSVMPFQSHSGETLPSEATALTAPVIRRVCEVFLVDVLLYCSISQGVIMNHEWIYKARENANTCIQTQLTGQSMPIGSLPMSWDSDTCLKIREHSQLALKDLKSVETFPMFSCAIVFPLFAQHVFIWFHSVPWVLWIFYATVLAPRPSSCSICLRFCKGLNVRPDGSQRQKRNEVAPCDLISLKC